MTHALYQRAAFLVGRLADGLQVAVFRQVETFQAVAYFVSSRYA
jgi:hypothetical protein